MLGRQLFRASHIAEKYCNIHNIDNFYRGDPEQCRTDLFFYIEPLVASTQFLDLDASGIAPPEVVAAIGAWTERHIRTQVFAGGVGKPVGLSGARPV